MTDYTQIRLDVADGIAILTLHRPEKMNAFTGTMMREMQDAFDRTHDLRLERVPLTLGCWGLRGWRGYGRALRLYRGHYLEDDPYADLFALERDYLRELAVRSLLRCAEEQEALGQTQAALASYSHLLTLDPLHFEANEAMIDVLIRRGQVDDARARWERYAQAYGGQPPRPAP